MVPLYSRTSVTIDEAIANLLGLIDGPVQYQCREDVASAVELAEFEALSYDLNEDLQDDYEYHQAALAEARHDNAHANFISDLSARVATAKKYIDLANRCRCAIDDELLRPTPTLLVDSRLSTSHTTYVTLESLLRWAAANPTIADLRLQLPATIANLPISQSRVDQNQPWWQPVKGDPPAEQDWYVPARYFARQLVSVDPGLRNKRDVLARKVVEKLTEAGIKKRGGVKPFESGTVLKAFRNVVF